VVGERAHAGRARRAVCGSSNSPTPKKVKKSSENKGEITLSQLTEILSDVKKEMQSKFKEMQDTFDEDAFAAMAQAVDQIVAEKHGASSLQPPCK